MALAEKLKTKEIYTTRTNCRLCGSEQLRHVWSFGRTPLANSYLSPAAAEKNEEPFVPLDVYYCGTCHLAQLCDVVDPAALFDHYLYVSSTSPTFVKHFEDYAASLIERFHLGSDDLVVDVGSNDGVLLKPLKAAGVQVLGIDPAENVAEIARAEGIETVAEYFTPEVAEEIAARTGKTAIIAANNVFAHTDAIDAFTAAVKRLLAPGGVFVFEVQYLGDLIAKNLFDIVYHEHVNYYSLHPLVTYFAKQGMEVFDVERPAVHGGSLRVFVQFAGGPHQRSAKVQELLSAEREQGLTSVTAYRDFARRIERNKAVLQQLLRELKRQGKRIVGYGAPAKATTLCYAFGLDGTVLDYIVDDAPLKQGLVMPGTHIPIYSPDVLYEEQPNFAPGGASLGTPEFCLILAWNFAGPIMQNHQAFADQGGRFIIPVPEPRIV